MIREIARFLGTIIDILQSFNFGIKFQALAICIVLCLPWIFLTLEKSIKRRILSSIWYIFVLLWILYYLGFLQYRYMGPHLGFIEGGNPLSITTLIIGLLFTIPFLYYGVKGRLEDNRKALLQIGLVSFLMTGPAVYNLVSLELYLFRGGGFGPYIGDFAGEITVFSNPEIWSESVRIGLTSCFATPLLICFSIWLIWKKYRQDIE